LVRSEYTWGSVVDKLLSAYEGAIGSPL
jgi:hypothetical protein